MVDRKVEYADRKLTRPDINRKIAEFQRALQNARIDPRPLGKELYDIFVKPIEGDLQGANAKTILWSLDGSLRYIPMAALSPDGRSYLAERYQNVIVTLARQSKLFDEPSGNEWRALGAGVSKPHEGFSALPSVVSEINSIVREGSATGVLEGKKLIDEGFNLETLRDTLPSRTEDGRTFNVVHLATHFKLGANDQDSALLLGDGKRLSLFEISKDEDLDFKNVDLLTLSACQTAIAAGDGSGREVESLGMLAQKKGAKAVLATLWKVADDPTAAFMSEFYRLKNANPKLSKAEAIRLTQVSMIQGKIKPSTASGGCRAENFGSGKANEFKCDPNAPFAHPASWSPFILIGNWR
jgi:CHAT domain-containing protein